MGNLLRTLLKLLLPVLSYFEVQDRVDNTVEFRCVT